MRVHALAQQVIVWSICRMAFFFTTPKSTSMPKREYRLSVPPASHRDKNANGTDSGRDSRMIAGWPRLSNWEARIMYMKTIDRRNAQQEFAEGVLQFAALAARRAMVYAGRHVQVRRRACRSASSRSPSA